MMMRIEKGRAAAVAMVTRAVAGCKFILVGRHVCVVYQPTCKVWRRSGFLTSTSRVKWIVVTVVVHDGVVREARHETHCGTLACVRFILRVI